MQRFINVLHKLGVAHRSTLIKHRPLRKTLPTGCGNSYSGGEQRDTTTNIDLETHLCRLEKLAAGSRDFFRYHFLDGVRKDHQVLQFENHYLANLLQIYNIFNISYFFEVKSETI